MAFKKDVTEENTGYQYLDTYIRLAHFRWSDANMRAVATFSIWKDKDARENGLTALGMIEVDATSDFLEIQKKLYLAAKIDPQFKGAVDV